MRFFEVVRELLCSSLACISAWRCVCVLLHHHCHHLLDHHCPLFSFSVVYAHDAYFVSIFVMFVRLWRDCVLYIYTPTTTYIHTAPDGYVSTIFFIHSCNAPLMTISKVWFGWVGEGKVATTDDRLIFAFLQFDFLFTGKNWGGRGGVLWKFMCEEGGYVAWGSW